MPQELYTIVGQFDTCLIVTSGVAYICEPFPKDIKPIALQNILLYHALVLTILLQEDSLLRGVAIFTCRVSRLLNGSPTGEGALEPMLPVIVHRRSEHHHEGELEKEHAIENKGFIIAPCFEPLCDDVGATVDHERRSAGY
jgi:hypothetical protein